MFTYVLKLSKQYVRDHKLSVQSKEGVYPFFVVLHYVKALHFEVPAGSREIGN